MKKLIQIPLLLFLFITHNIIFAQSTPNGTDVSSEVNNNVPVLTDDQIRAINRRQVLEFPNVVKVDEPTHTYNCHGYAWIKYDGGGDYWLNSPGDDLFWLDNSYVQTSNTTGEGLRVSYQGDHSAVTTSTPGQCISKWGRWGRYIHNTTNVLIDYLPSSPLTYYGRCVNLQNMTYDWGNTVNTVNFVSSGGTM